MSTREQKKKTLRHFNAKHISQRNFFNETGNTYPLKIFQRKDFLELVLLLAKNILGYSYARKKYTDNINNTRGLLYSLSRTILSERYKYSRIVFSSSGITLRRRKK